MQNIEELWTILAPTIRGYSQGSIGGGGNNNNKNVVDQQEAAADNFSVENTNVPLLGLMFDVRNAVEQRLAIESYLNYASAVKTRQQYAFTWKLFEMEQPEKPTLPQQH